MEKIIQQGRLLFGIAIAASGVEGVICAHLGLTVRGVPWFPSNPFLAYLTGIALLLAGLCIVANVRARVVAILLGILFLLYVLLAELPLVAASPKDLGARTIFLRPWPWLPPL